MSEKNIAEIIKRAMAVGTEDYEQEVAPMRTEIREEEKADLEKFVLSPKPNNLAKKVLKGIKTGTLVDDLFLDSEGKSIDGIPEVLQLGITGLPSSGKSILIEEIAIRKANEEVNVLLVTSEDIFQSDSARMDLQARLKQKADSLGLDWGKVTKSLYVLDSVAFSELTDWFNFAKVYRYVTEKYGIKLVLIDSITLLETSRGALKNRLRELCRYNQVNGITALYVNQRAGEETDQFSMAGGIALSHILDSVLIIDVISYWDHDLMKQDYTEIFGAPPKRKQVLRIARLLGNRIGNYNGHYQFLEITKDGFLKKVTV